MRARTLLVLGAAVVLLAGAGRASAQTARELNEEATRLVQRDLAAAEKATLQALEVARAANDVEQEAYALVNMNRIVRARGDYAKATEHLAAARALTDAGDDVASRARVAADSAILYSMSGLLGEALEQGKRALTLYRSVGNRAAESSVLITLGNVLSSRGDYDAGREHYEKALAIKRADGIRKGVGMVLNNLADLELLAGRANEALRLLDEARAAHAAEGDRASLALVEVNRGAALTDLGRFDEAQAALDEALAIGRETGSARVTAAAHERRANLAMLRAKGAPDAAERLRAADYEAVAALEAMAGMQDEERVERVTRLRAQIAERAGDLAAALGFQRDAEAARSRRLENEERARLDVLAARYRSERQAAEIRVLTEKGATQDAELARQRLARNSLFGSIAAMSVIALLLVARARQRAQSAKLLQEKNAALADALADAHRQRLDAQALAAENAEILRIAAVDLHGPLVDVLGRAERLLTVPGMPPEAQRTAAAVAHSIGNVVHVVRNLTESAELERDVEPLARAPVDLDRLIEDVVARLRPRAAAKRQEIRVAAGTPVRLPAERERLEEALENLLSNAIKFSAPGKPIDIAVATDAEHARISVRDHGAGLTPDDFRRLFGKFQRLSSRPTAGEPSSGLGLALVRQVAERHGGRAYAESDGPGKGSVFVIELPVRDAARPL